MKPKRCPTCGRTYIDETLSFCLEDGAPLVYHDSGAEPATAIFPGTVTGEAPTRQMPATADHPIAQPTEEHALGRSKRLWIAAAVVALLIAGGAFAYFYGIGGGRRIDSIAVMPFANASGNPDLEYLSDGITESLINSLTRVPNLSVKARSSVFTYKGKDVSPQQVAKDLAVEAVLNGRLVQRGDAVTLNLELIEAATGNQLWGEQYNRKLSDLTSLQSEIARDVSAKLHTRLTGTDEQRVTKNYTQNPEAYQLYLKGKYHWNRRSRADILKSIDYFRQAVEMDPNYALAYSGLAEAYILLPAYAGQDPQAAYTSARTAAARALELDNTLAEAHAALAVVLSEYDWNFAEAERSFRRAIDLNPNYPTAHHWYAEFLMSMGRMPEALTEIRRAQEMDPLSLIINGIYGIVLGLNDQHDEAFAQLQRTLEMDPNFARTHIFLAELYQDVGRFEEAANEFHKVSVLSGMPESQVAEAHKRVLDAYRREGPKGYYRVMAGLLEERLKAREAGNPPPVTVVAANWLRAGDKERAYQLLEEGLRRRDPTMLRLRDPVFDPIKDEERFRDIARRVGMPD
jgi:TolB-like protein/Flp pilus assembly protein TadD